RRARAAHHDAGKSPPPAIIEAHNTYIDIALLENTIVDKKGLHIVADFQKWIAPSPYVIDQLLRHVHVHAAGPEVISMKARARGAFVEHHELFAFLKTP